MERTEKVAEIEALKAKLVKAQSIVMADFRGLTVDKDTALRNELRKAGCEYKVIKNRLVGLAVKGTPMEVMTKALKGPTGIAYSFEDASAPAKVLTKFVKAEETVKLKLKGAYIDGKLLDEKGVESLATMPGKDEVRATFLATLLAVPQNFMRLALAAQQNFVYLLRAREEKENGGAK